MLSCTSDSKAQLYYNINKLLLLKSFSVEFNTRRFNTDCTEFVHSSVAYNKMYFTFVNVVTNIRQTPYNEIILSFE